jgi:hypothetical protein
MPGATVTKLPRKNDGPKIVTLTPEMAMAMLEHNQLNRPLNDQHVQRISRQITAGKWRFNGDTIKIADSGDVLDGQHRLWAIIESKIAVETIVVHGIERDAFATIDTLRKPRSGADTIALNGASRYRNIIASALTWMLRWQRGALEGYTAPQNKIENSDIEEAFQAHPGIARAVERVMKLRDLVNPSILAFAYYATANRNEALAEQMVETLIDPSGIGVNDPFFRLRCYFASDHHKRKEALMTIALTFKALNAAKEGKKIQSLSWRSQGKTPEEFPTLNVGTELKRSA